MKIKPNYLYGVDLMRFGAAVAVMLFHLGYVIWATQTSRGALWQESYELPGLAPWTWFGWVGVNVFFVISGFVIANSADRATPLNFVRSRVLRLYPALWICTPVTLAVLVAVAYSPVYNLLKATVTSMVLFPTGPWLEGVYWTLGVEIVFYAMVFLMLLTGTWRHAEWLGAGLTVWSTSYLVLLALDTSGTASMPFVQGLAQGDYRLLLLEYGSCFGLGLLLALLAKERLGPLGAAAIALACIGGVLQIYCQTLDINTRGERSVVDLPAVWFVPATLWLACCLGIWASARWRDGVSRSLGRLTTVAYWCGQMTYPLYLIHFSVGLFLMRLLVTHGLPPIVALIVVCSGLVAFSFVVCAWLEPRLRAALAIMFDAGVARLPLLGRLQGAETAKG